MAPELFNGDSDRLRPTQESDIYSLAMVVIEVFTGQVPFHKLIESAVILRIVKGKRPLRPEGSRGLGFSDDVWGMVERCWHQEPGQRPKISEVQACFRNAVVAYDAMQTPALSKSLDLSSPESFIPAGAISPPQKLTSALENRRYCHLHPTDFFIFVLCLLSFYIRYYCSNVRDDRVTDL